MGMEWFTFNDQLLPDQLIEGYQSFIWTERYSAAGDFQIITKSTYENRTLLTPETYIGKVGSTYVMKVDTVQDIVGTDGKRNLTVTGKSLEALLDDRVAMPALDNLTNTPNWVLTGTPADIARELFNRICVETALDVHDSIPFYQFGTFLPEGNLTEPPGIITLTAAPDTLYSTLKQLCDTYGLGFRLVWAPPDSAPAISNVFNFGSVNMHKKQLAGAGTRSGSFGGSGSVKMKKKKLSAAGSMTGGGTFAITHVGANGGPDGATGQTQAQFADAQTQIGPGTMIKIFYNTVLNSWTSASGSGVTPSAVVAAYPNVIPLLCWNDTMTTAQMNTFIASVPSGQTVALCWQQEAENPTSDFANGGEFLNGISGNALRAGWIDQANKVIAGRGSKNILNVVCSTWGQYMPTGRGVDGSFLPSNSITDYFCMDIYQHQAGGFQNGATTWPTNGLSNHSGFQKWVSLVKAKNGHMGITEYGIDDTGTVAARAARIQADYAYLKSAFNGGSASPFPLWTWLYWWHNMAASNTHYKFTDGPAVAAWQGISADAS